MIILLAVKICSAAADPALSPGEAAQIASAFCAAAGSASSRVAQALAPAAPALTGPSPHHWRPLWRVRMQDGARLEIADVSGIVVGFVPSAAPSRVRRADRQAIGRDEAARRAVAILAASGQDTDVSKDPDIALSPNRDMWIVRWKRVWNGVPYAADDVVLALDRATDAVRSFEINFLAPPPADGPEAVTAQQAVDDARQAVLRLPGVRDVQILPPEKLVVSAAATPQSAAQSRVAWRCRFAAPGGQIYSAFVNVRTGCVFDVRASAD